MDKYFLQRIHMQAFGRFYDKTIGPFSSGLNVVYGENEAGKTTLNAFMHGVLFGWTKAGGSKNPYKPSSGERAGSLIFAPCNQSGGTHGTVELSRERNKDGLIAVPESAAALVGDIDETTYARVFALTSDELRDLKNAGSMASRLLTAGSGTKKGPSEVLAEIDSRIKDYTSSKAAALYSFPNLKKRMESCQEQLSEARKRSDTFKDEDAEHRERIIERDRLAKEFAQANTKAEKLAVLKVELERLNTREIDAQKRCEDTQRDAALYESAVQQALNAGGERLSASDEASLRELIERDQKAQIRAEERLELAQNDFNDARAYYEAKKQMAESPKAAKRSMLPFLASIALALIGLAWIIGATLAGITIASVIGFICLVASVVSAIVAALRIRSGVSHRPDETEDAYATMMHKKSILDSRESELLQVKARINEFLESANLSEAQGSLRRATELIDEAHRARMAYEQAKDKLNQASLLLDAAQDEIVWCREQRSKNLTDCGFDEAASLEEVGLQIDQTTQQRDALADQLAECNRRLGELKQILSTAEHEQSLELLKIKRAQIATLQQESSIELARLLLARRMLTDALHIWESESQPEVYARASDLFSLMTDGAWREVRVDDSGSISAIDVVDRSWKPELLSMGTCQQLYLALRIALLECVDSVGVNIPVLADDILVNFDDKRRLGAVRALIELSKKRQVIVFTCHKEIKDLLSQRAEDCCVLGL